MGTHDTAQLPDDRTPPYLFHRDQVAEERRGLRLAGTLYTSLPRRPGRLQVDDEQAIHRATLHLCAAASLPSGIVWVSCDGAITPADVTARRLQQRAAHYLAVYVAVPVTSA
jgi:hypothetical protein